MIPTLRDSLSRLRALPDDLRLIRDHIGLNVTGLARTLGVDHPRISEWEHRVRLPREPLVILVILAWADEIRKGQGENGTQKLRGAEKPLL